MTTPADACPAGFICPGTEQLSSRCTVAHARAFCKSAKHATGTYQAVPCNLSQLLQSNPLAALTVDGTTAAQLVYGKGMPAGGLYCPGTSPAGACPVSMLASALICSGCVNCIALQSIALAVCSVWIVQIAAANWHERRTLLNICCCVHALLLVALCPPGLLETCSRCSKPHETTATGSKAACCSQRLCQAKRASQLCRHSNSAAGWLVLPGPLDHPDMPGRAVLPTTVRRSLAMFLAQSLPNRLCSSLHLMGCLHRRHHLAPCPGAAVAAAAGLDFVPKAAAPAAVSAASHCQQAVNFLRETGRV